VSEACDRFEREGLLQLERGEPLDPHFAGCAECRAAQAAYERLAASLQRQRTEEPQPGWEQRVLAAIDAPPVHARRRRALPWVPAGLAAAAAAVALVVGAGLVSRSASPALEVDVTPSGGSPLRAAAPHAGDRLLLKARLGGASHAELRIYRDDRELVLRCGGQGAGCARRGDELTAELPLPSIGSFQPVLATSQSPLPAPAPTLDEDSARLLQAGARVTLGKAVRAY
jgi:hypothetical protein